MMGTPTRKGVRKASVFFLTLLLSISSACLRPKIESYPAGIVFPLEEAGQVAFEGRINSALVKGEDGRFYFSTDTGHLYCLDVAAQQLIWHQTNPSPFGCPPLLSPDRLFVWDQENTVFCYDLKGNIVWKTSLPDKISSPISRDGERVYLGTGGDDFLALSQATGEPLWRFRTKGAVAAPAVFFGDSVILGSGDGRVYLLNPKGAERKAIDLGSAISAAPLVDGGRLYIGTEDFGFHCYDLETMKRKWMIKGGGRLLVSPRADEKRVYFQASNSVLYALDKKGGNILWWWIAPSRSAFELGLEGQGILATSRSPLLFSLERTSGKAVGSYEAKTEIRSNPVWAEPNLAVAVLDPTAERETITFLRKKVKVEILASPASPQPAGTEVTFTAEAAGFFRPKYEFFLRRGEERSVVQEAGEKNSWVWYADNEGSVAVGVRVSDEKQAKEAEIRFEISKKEKEK